MPLTLQIITPERIVFSEEDVESVTLPGVEGELTVLPSHAPLMTALASGALFFRKDGVEVDVAVAGGFLEVRTRPMDISLKGSSTDCENVARWRIRPADSIAGQSDGAGTQRRWSWLGENVQAVIAPGRSQWERSPPRRWQEKL